MRREIIQDFLNVPGIVGVALMGGTSTPYFRGFEAENRPEFSLPQQMTIAQNIQQVLETIPEGFNSFEFQFDDCRAYLHKLNRGTTLLVLTLNHLTRLTYTQAVRRLLIELQIDQSDPISEFRALTLDMLPPQPIEPTGQLSYASQPSLGSEPFQPSPPPPSQPAVSSLSASPSSRPRNPTSSHQPQPAANGTGPGIPKPPATDSSVAKLSEATPYPKPTPSQQKSVQNVSPSLIQPPTGSTPSLVTADVLPTDVPTDVLTDVLTDTIQPLQAHGLPSSNQTVQPTSVQPISLWQADVDREKLDREELDQEELDQEETELVPDLAEPDLREPDGQAASLKDVLAAINRLSQFTSQYLGTLVVSNYWKATCPTEAWLSHFQIERSAQMTFAVQIPSQPLPILTAKQHQCLKNWVAAFLERCSKVMRNFSKIVRQALTSQELALLFD